MDFTDFLTLRNALLLLINSGVVFRIAYCRFQMIHDEEGQIYKKRIRHALVFAVIVNNLIAFKDIVLSYLT